jgi:hypothetical protein
LWFRKGYTDATYQTCKKSKITVHKFARGMKERILDFMVAIGDYASEGNQARKMRLELKNVTREEAVWASDFNTYHDGCTEPVKNWLVENYRNCFRS